MQAFLKVDVYHLIIPIFKSAQYFFKEATFLLACIWLAHNSPFHDEYQSQSAKVLALPWEQAHQDESNDAPHPLWEFQVRFLLLRIKIIWI